MCYSALVRKDLDFLAAKFGASVVRESFDQYMKAVAVDPKKFPPIERERIFPGHYAPVIYEKSGKRFIEPMRYNAFPPSFVADGSKYTTYNARRDNLRSRFWSEMVGKNHGVILVGGFFEWVKVSRLLKAGVVSLQQVKDEFARQAESRKKKIEEAGKAYKATPSEKKAVELRDIVIGFKPLSHVDLTVPVIFSAGSDGPLVGKGFAIVTDDPPQEVILAGHDRCPVVLSREGVGAWLACPDSSAGEEKVEEILDMREAEVFSHQLANAV